jgi:hypothetical protein
MEKSKLTTVGHIVTIPVYTDLKVVTF